MLSNKSFFLHNFPLFYLLTSSADCAMKNPTVFEGNFVPLGLMEILLSFPSSFLTSIANRSNLSLTKQSLRRTNKYLIKAESMHTIIISTYSEA